MIIATISKTKNNLSALLDQVKAGQTVLILDRKRPVAKIEPVTSIGGQSADSRLDLLERRGAIKRGSGKPPRQFWRGRLAKTMDGSSVVESLIEERRAGR